MPSSTPYFSMAASVSPPPASEKALLRAMAWAIVRVPSPNWSNSNTPTGPFQTMVPAALQQRAEAVGRVRTDVEDHLIRAHLADRAHVGVRGGGELRGHHHIDRQRDLRAARARLSSRRRAISSMSVSYSDLPTLTPVAARKVLAMPPPTISWSTSQQRLEHRELGGDLGAADDRDQRPRRLLQRALERLELTDQQRSGAGHRREARHAVGAGLGAMRGAEGIHHEHVAQRGHAARQRLVVLLLALVEAHVLAQHRRAGRAVDAVQPVLAQRHRLAQQLREPRRHRRERERRIVLALLGATEVRQHEHLGVLVQRLAEGRQGPRGCARRW